jgi:threonyl-tRNA synthetase
VIVTFPDGTSREYEKGTRLIDVAKSLGQKLYKNALSASVNGKTADLCTPLEEDASVRFHTFADDEGRHALRHTASHIMAQAVKRLFPGTVLAIGPAIENGFYYDFDTDKRLSEEDFAAIEAEMDRIVKADLPLERFEMPRAEALEFVRGQGETYKVELIEDLPEEVAISFYRQGDFVDLCAGPHVPSTGKVRKIKLLSVAGAYWRGDEKNKMLQRIYGTAFEKKSDLDDYLHRLEEAKKRDHRKLGRELDLFNLMDEGPGFPFFYPKGMIIKNTLIDFWREEHVRRGYEEIQTPVILSRDLWERSGHWGFYGQNMYTTRIDEQDFAIKPMNCAGGMLVYERRIHSYRDLPIRMGELGLVHRHELSGALHGLMRVRCFTQDDAHIFMTREQMLDEIMGVIDLTRYVYGIFGFRFHVELSTRPEKSMGSDEGWETATNALREALEESGLPYKINPGDGAFYGPKIDFHLEDSIGRTWQCGTIQLDFQMPERFELTYVGADGEKHRPVMIHRVIFGSIERFIGILTEHFAGAFPAWLAPVQVRVLTITDRCDARAMEIDERLKGAGLRSETDLRNEKIGFKIREAQAQRIPYMLVIGDKEVENGTVSVRSRSEGDLGAMAAEDFAGKLCEEIRTKKL